MRRASNVPTGKRLSRFSRIRQSFRDGAHHVGSAIREDVRHGLERVRRVPRWVRILSKIYHDYGLKHVCLISILVAYQFLGAGVFYLCEAGFDEEKEKNWIKSIAQNRTKFVESIIPLMFNNTDYLFFVTEDQSKEIGLRLVREMANYEKQLGIRYTDQKIKWDFWNAMLYAQTICTTIGYGHLYPSTVPGKIFTMIYAIFGIPLVLSILDDLGKLLTRCLKTPWWLIKCGCRRIFRYCTKQTIAEIRKLDLEDKQDLEIFDLPIPIAIFVVIAWIFICSATFCIWESDWDYFIAFYFFFISLSTIGLGDITPTQPKYLLMLFIYIIIGLSLVSMCINLIQAKLERTYEVGHLQRLEMEALQRPGGLFLEPSGAVRRRGSSLGVFRSSSSVHSLTKEVVQAALANRRRTNKTCQTVLSFPSPSSTNTAIARSVANSRARFIPRSLSIDDVMRMVDSEDGDIIVLTDLVREESGISQSSRMSVTSSDEGSTSSRIVVSKSFDAEFASRLPSADVLSPLQPSRSSDHVIHQIEAIEELEDRIAMGQIPPIGNSVHFRSRLSLIPEHVPSTVEEGDEHEPSDDSHPLSITENSSTSDARSQRSLHSVFNYLSRKRPRRQSNDSKE